MEEKKSFNDLINSETPTLVDFFATWCGPCQMMQPVLKELAQRAGNKVTIIKIDVDKNPGVAEAHRIQGVPTLMLFRSGKLLWRQSGFMNSNQLESVLSKIVVEPVKS